LQRLLSLKAVASEGQFLMPWKQRRRLNKESELKFIDRLQTAFRRRSFAMERSILQKQRTARSEDW